MGAALPTGVTMSTTTYFPCDLCGSDDAEKIEILRPYVGDQVPSVCRQCGFVYVQERRSSEAVATVWTDEIFGHAYTARIPAIKARQVFVAEHIDTTIGLHGKSVCDIGGGEGLFLDMLHGPDYGAEVFAIEPSAAYCSAMAERGIENFAGTLEQYLAGDTSGRRFDVVTIIWTLENCSSCRDMLDGSYRLLKEGGHIVVATGSRLLVPFKKPLQLYIGKNPADSHAFRFSANTLGGLLATTGFANVRTNRYIDHDVLCMIGEKISDATPRPWPKDDYRALLDFFERWHRESARYYVDIHGSS